MNDKYEKGFDQIRTIGFNMSSTNSSFYRNLNRYSDVLPYDSNRILVKKDKYINASRLHVEGCPYNYIATQAPMSDINEINKLNNKSDTVDDFWNMVWENQVIIIVMLTNFIEKDKIKADAYFPLNFNDKFMTNDFEIKLVNEKQTKSYTLRKLYLYNKNTNITRAIDHVHCHSWPDMGCPDLSDQTLLINPDNPYLAKNGSGRDL